MTTRNVGIEFMDHQKDREIERLASQLSAANSRAEAAEAKAKTLDAECERLADKVRFMARNYGEERSKDRAERDAALARAEAAEAKAERLDGRLFEWQKACARMETERDALAAHVEALREALSGALGLLKSGREEGQVGERLIVVNASAIWTEWSAALSAIPAQLRESRDASWKEAAVTMCDELDQLNGFDLPPSLRPGGHAYDGLRKLAHTTPSPTTEWKTK